LFITSHHASPPGVTSPEGDSARRRFGEGVGDLDSGQLKVGEPDHPATLDIVYRERLSRGLVLVKRWLLAMAQYAIVAVFGPGI
jgi:hypothetical protein